jgi:hypothetical protein
LILKEKAKQFCADKEIQALLAEIRNPAEAGLHDAGGVLGAYTRKRAEELKAQSFDRQALALRRLPYEQLDQLVVDLLLGAR